jgi:hypothetical protein
MSSFDLYFLINSRSQALILEYLDFVIEKRAEVSDDYPVPIYSDNPLVVYTDVNELMEYLEKAGNESYSLYFRNLDPNSKAQTAMCFYTNDAKAILGLTVNDMAIDGTETLYWYNKIKDRFKCEYSYITSEEPPPEDSVEFLEYSRTRFSPL